MNLKTSILFILILFCGCINLPQQFPVKQDVIAEYDVNSLKTTDKTYKICEKNPIHVYDEGKKISIVFDDKHFIVNSDFMKTFNENQDYIIKKLNKNYDKTDIYLCILIVLIAILLVLKIVFRNKD